MSVQYLIEIKVNVNDFRMVVLFCSKTNWQRFLSLCSMQNTCCRHYFGTCSTGKSRCRTACRHCLEEIRSAQRSWRSASRSTAVHTCRTCWNLWSGRSLTRRHQTSRWILPGNTNARCSLFIAKRMS